ncbi:MAG: hypothetical protein DI536_16780 [Archangium gephyra]|uniref:Uncharacterized protein n=1 Tax=Archangium gephyra TaxID=48 RepID=A0A2W5T8Y7_9BACT|nr:MAG: hypothetical protein DI536_16780 [Archangium gephyra]
MVKTFEKAVTGFNHNIKHKGKVYHVQTEDSGVANPHIITHLFVGGNILATKKSSYTDIVKSENLAELVREMMEEQHKQMLRNLINGTYDNVDRSATAYQPGELDMGAAAAKAAAVPAPAKPVAPAPLQLTNLVPTPVAPVASSPSLPPEVLAARQLTEKPRENNVGVETLFGEDLISEKSLDEVILSYLAGDGR